MGWSLDDRDKDMGLGAETRLSSLLSGLSGVEEASGASLSARSLELILSVKREGGRGEGGGRRGEVKSDVICPLYMYLPSFDWSNELSLL